MRKNIGRRVLSLLLCLVMVASYLPVGVLRAGAEPMTLDTVRLTDPSTIDQWKRYFGVQTNHPNGVTLSTEFAGGVWTDKSVFTPADVPQELTRATYRNKTFSITDKGDNFLVALSALASNKQIKGYSTIPTDTVLILDLSSSMRTINNNSSAVDELAEATNKAITELMALNENNRVAVVAYAGTDNASWSARNGKTRVLLPLDTYTTTRAGVYLEAYNRDLALRVVSGVCNSAGQAVNTGSEFETSTGTFAQDGLYMGMQELLNANPVVEEGFQAGTNRIPIMVLMTDGEPTLGHETYHGVYTTDAAGKKVFTDLGNSTMFSYSGSTADRNGHTHRDTIAFVSSLTAAFAKSRITDHYGEQGLMYTLAYGSTVTTRSEAMSFLNPEDSSSIQNELWNAFLNGEDVTVYRWTTGSGRQQQTHYLTTKNATDPDLRLTAEDRYYVDEFFTATNDEAMSSAFDAIVDEIELQSRYYPTYVENDHNHDGYLTFVDKIGSYMEISDVKGLVIGNRLFSGEALASMLMVNNNNVSMTNDQTNRFLQSVCNRLNITNTTIAQTLVNNAYRHGQLAYNAGTGAYSNYIGWFSDDEGNFIDFWHKDLAREDYPAEATHIMRSFGFLGDTTDIPGVPNTDMMFMTVRIATSISSGDSILTWKIPASLVPTVTYDVEVVLDSAGNLSGLQGLELADNSATDPIRLLYEVELRSDINEWNILEKTNGIHTFYTNKFDASDPFSTTLNTYSHFEPSQANERYYYTSDQLIYTNTDGTVYTGEKPVSGTYYHRFPVYEKTSSGLRIHYHFEPITATSLALAESAGNNQWVIPKGTVLRYQDDVTTEKTENTTQTMAYSDHPEIVAEGGHYYTYSTQGNNGKLTVTPATGIKLSKVLAEAVEGASNSFTFTVSGNITGAQVIRLNNAGEEASREALSENGQVTLAAGETVYIIGLEAGSYTVTENNHQAYTVTAVTVAGQLQNGTAANLTLTAERITDVRFTNSPKGYGNLLITKEVRHNHPGHMVPAAMLETEFTVTVNVGQALAGQTFSTVYGTTAGQITVGEDGSFTVNIRHGQTFEVIGLPDGTVATVTENTEGVPAYYSFDYILTRDHSGAEQDRDNVVTIGTDANATAVIHNVYDPANTTAELDVKFTKNFIIESPLAEEIAFTFRLDRWIGNDWQAVYSYEVQYEAGQAGIREYTKQDILEGITYTEAGDYAYRIIEIVPEDTEKVSGVSYDRTEYNFTVRVTDEGGRLAATVMDDGAPVTGAYEASFTNTYHTAPVSLEIRKELKITSGDAEVPKSGFLFEAYEAAVDGEGNWTLVDDTPDMAVRSDAAGHARFAAIYDAVGTHYYVVKEKNEGRPGWTYDTTEYQVTVEVTDDGTGDLSATVTVVAAGTAEPVTGPVSFTNTYDPTDVKVDLNAAVRKALTGRTLQAGEFTFALFEDGTANHTSVADAILTGTNAADGSVALGSLSFHKIGVYAYDVLEILPNAAGKAGGITYDSRIYDMVVEITDDHNGNLIANWYFEDEAAETVTFRNSYATADVDHVIDGTKVMTGRPLLLGGFKFRLTQVADANGTALEGGKVLETENGHADKNNAAQFRFPAITYTGEGTHYYRIEEVNTGAAGVTYSNAQYIVRVDVTDNGRGNLVANETIVSGGSSITFTNSYKPQPVTTNLRSIKELHGKVLTAGQFSFTITQTGSDFATAISGGLQATVTNDANGLIQFPDITFTGEATRYYVVREVNGGRIIDGITYDDSEYRVTITATDNLLGDLVLVTDIKVRNTFTGAQGTQETIAPVSSILFVNEYAIDGDAALVLSGTKTYTGGTLTDGKFTFELYNADSEFVAEAAPMATVTNAGNSYNFYINYTEEDAGKTFYYILREKNMGQTIDGITYDDTQYRITVKVEDDGVGGIQLTVTTDKTQSTDHKVTTVTGLDFENTYTAEPASVAIEGVKELQGMALEADQFQFQLFRADERFRISGAPMATVANDADGRFAFRAMEMTQAGTYYIVIKEVNGGQTIDGITYDDAEYRLTIRVTDDGTGKLIPAVSADGVNVQIRDTVATVTGLAFRNTYTAEPVTFTPQAIKRYERPEGEQMRAFTFTLTGEGENQTKQNSLTDGKVIFDELTFSEAKTYTYTISEQIPTQQDPVKYDTNVYTLTVVVNDNGLGQLEIGSITTTSVKGTDDLVFLNAHEDLVLKKDVFVAGDTAVSIDGKTVQTGTVLTYVITYTNYNNQVVDATVTDTIPQYTEYVAGSANNGGVYGEGKVVWELKDVAADETVTLTFRVKVTGGGAVVNRATVLDAGNTYASNEVSNPVKEDTLKKDVFTESKPTVSIDGETVTPGQTLVYQITYSNNDDFAAIVTITDSIPQHTTYVAGSADNGGVYAEGKLSWTLELAAGESVTVTFRVKVAEDYALTVINQAAADDGTNILESNRVTVETPPKPPVPETGDPLQMHLWIALLSISSAAMAVVLIFRRKILA